MGSSSQVPTSSQRPAKRRRLERPVKPLSGQLLDNCTVSLEEQLYDQAFALLSSVLGSGTCTSQPACIPPPSYLALAATLIVHPQQTTRTQNPLKMTSSDNALRYLRHLTKLVKPQDAGLINALKFVGGGGPNDRSKRAKTRRSGFDDMLDTPRIPELRSQHADQEALWSNAEDFWSVVGWAFNCSIKYKHRWARWKAWLEFMLDVLEIDLNDHLETGTAASSLFASYLDPIGEGRNNRRRLMRAILADGSTKALAEFHEIWRNETKVPKKIDEDMLNRNKTKRKLDLDNNEFGDYFDDSDDSSPAASTARQSRSATALSSRKASRQPSPHSSDTSEDNIHSTGSKSSDLITVETFGGSESILLRQRLLALLVRLCPHAPAILLDIEDLFDLFTEFLRPLPLAIFAQFTTPSRPYLDPDPQSSLVQMLLRPSLASVAPSYNANAVTQRDFEEFYAPFAANTSGAGDNAKVSLCMEGLMRLLWRTGNLVASERLTRAMREGFEARRAKIESGGGRKTGGRAREEEEALVVLGASRERMEVLLGMLV